MKRLYSNKAFTLIELLVVVAIIGILAAVVLASLTSARDKGKDAAIKSDLKNMIGQAELSYSSVSPNNYSTACSGVAKMITGIVSLGGLASCYSNNVAGDVNLRWGASAKNPNGVHYSVDSEGLVTFGTVNLGATSTAWDVASGTTTIDWATAKGVCATVGGRLPSAEQLKALYDAYGGTPAGFSGAYWSSTTDPSLSTSAYAVGMGSGLVGTFDKGGTSGVRCVR